jgi:hypothetical protein
MLNAFPKRDLVALLALREPARTLALLAALRFISGHDLLAQGTRAHDLTGFIEDDAVFRLPLQRTVTTSKPIDVYALRHGGAVALAKAMGIDAASVPRETRSSCRRSVTFMDHTMATSRFALMLARGLGETGTVKLESWATGAEGFEAEVGTAEDIGTTRVILIPDAIATIAAPRGPEMLLIEIDRGTERPSYMANKYAAYLAWWSSGHHRSLGTDRIRILTVTPDARRSMRLVGSCREATHGKAPGLFWFASEDELAANGLCGNVWATPAARELPLWKIKAAAA